MPEYIVRWDAGFGDSYEIVEAVDEDDAMSQAADLWQDEAESSADYEVIGEATEELKKEYRLQED